MIAARHVAERAPWNKDINFGLVPLVHVAVCDNDQWSKQMNSGNYDQNRFGAFLAHQCRVEHDDSKLHHYDNIVYNNIRSLENH